MDPLESQLSLPMNVVPIRGALISFYYQPMTGSRACRLFYQQVFTTTMLILVCGMTNNSLAD